MALQFSEEVVNFDPSSSQTQHKVVTSVFSGQVQRATVALKGFGIQFNNGDHNLFAQTVDAFVIDGGIVQNTVTAQVDFLLRDNNADDPFSGSVALVVLAEVA